MSPLSPILIFLYMSSVYSNFYTICLCQAILYGEELTDRKRRQKALSVRHGMGGSVSGRRRRGPGSQLSPPLYHLLPASLLLSLLWTFLSLSSLLLLQEVGGGRDRLPACRRDSALCPAHLQQPAYPTPHAYLPSCMPAYRSGNTCSFLRLMPCGLGL